MVVCQVSGPPAFRYASYCFLGSTVLGYTYIPRLQSEGPVGTRFAMAVMYSFVLANTSELSPIVRFRILATIAIEHCSKFYEFEVAINSCTSQRSHFGTSSVPPPMGADPASATFLFGVTSPCTSSKRASYRLVPFGFTPAVACDMFVVICSWSRWRLPHQVSTNSMKRQADPFFLQSPSSCTQMVCHCSESDGQSAFVPPTQILGSGKTMCRERMRR